MSTELLICCKNFFGKYTEIDADSIKYLQNENNYARKVFEFLKESKFWYKF